MIIRIHRSPVQGRQPPGSGSVLLTAFPVFFLLCSAATPASIPEASIDGAQPVVYLPIPPELSRDRVIAADQRLKDHLHRRTQAMLTSQTPGRAHAAGVGTNLPVTDRLIVFTDRSGQPIRPDLERATTGLAAAPLPQAKTAGNEITFTFDSPSFPWTTHELDVLNRTLSDCYPLAKEIYGSPAFDITVNVRKDPASAYAGLYYTSLNEMVLRGAAQPDPICHEMLHAFRDDDVISLGSYEEGMARAAEVEIFSRLPTYDYWNKNHQYTYDIYYEGLIKQKIGAQNGNLFSGYIAPLVRYQISGYAWAKILLESKLFLARFNQQLYARTLLDHSTPHSESKLIDIANTLKPRVESKTFKNWYSRQGIFNSNPPKGYFLYQRINQSTIDYFFRNDSGREIMQPGAEVSWSVYDHLNRCLDDGVGVTSANGWFDYHPDLPSGHVGRLKAVVRTASSDGLISDVTFRYAGTETGIFGVVRGANRGTLTITPLDRTSASVTLKLRNGSFHAPSLGSMRGRFRAVFVNLAGKTTSKRFNKDASDYFLMIRGW